LLVLRKKFHEVAFLQDVRGPELLEEPVQGWPFAQQERIRVLNGTTGNRCESFRTYGPYATMLNDITFDAFHFFHADSHMLTGFSTAPE
jgi:hypothetical protein